MSRTYRKNHRRFYKVRGEFYSSYNDRTIKGKHKDYKDYDWRDGTLPWGINGHREIVIVCDSENYNRSNCPSDMKKICRRIDRARYKAALRKDEDAHILSSYDPWDWD